MSNQIPGEETTYCLESLGHDFRAVVDSKYDICDTSSG